MSMEEGIIIKQKFISYGFPNSLMIFGEAIRSLEKDELTASDVSDVMWGL